MNTHTHKWQIMKYSAKVYDICIFIGAFLVAAFVQRIAPTGMTLSQFMALRITVENVLFFALVLLTWHNVFNLCGLYVSKRLTLRSAEIFEVCKATIVASALLLFGAKAFHIKMVTWTFVVIVW